MTTAVRTDQDVALDVVRPRRRWQHGGRPTEGPSALVWIDSREATIVRVRDGPFPIEHLASDVPARHRSTGHVRHDPSIRHGGGGPEQHAGEPHRVEHLGRFLGVVARRLDGERDIIIIGPGEVREHLARVVRGPAGFPAPDVLVHTEPAVPMTDRQLVALVRDLAGLAPRRGRRAVNEPPASWEPARPAPRAGASRERHRERITDALEPIVRA
jgi:hypothetical protein